MSIEYVVDRIVIESNELREHIAAAHESGVRVAGVRVATLQ